MVTPIRLFDRNFWTVFLVFFIIGIAFSVRQDASIIESVAIGLAAGLVIAIVVRLLRRKKMPA